MGLCSGGAPFAILERRASNCRSERKSLDQELKVVKSEVQLRMKKEER